MKTIFSLLLLAFTLNAVAQPNNPYNQQCMDMYVSGNIILNKLKAPKDKTITPDLIKEMQQAIPSKTQMDPQLAGRIMQTIKRTPISISEALKNSKLSVEAQKEINIIIKNSTFPKRNQQKQWLTEKTSKILESSFSQNEKEVLLIVIGLTYHAEEQMARGPRCAVEVDGEIVSSGEGMECAGVAAVFGFLVGSAICGLPCGIGGAIIGFVSVVASIS